MSEKLPPLYGKRWAVERIFSRLKEELGIKMIKVRGLWKVYIHVSFIAYRITVNSFNRNRSRRAVASR